MENEDFATALLNERNSDESNVQRSTQAAQEYYMCK